MRPKDKELSLSIERRCSIKERLQEAVKLPVSAFAVDTSVYHYAFVRQILAQDIFPDKGFFQSRLKHFLTIG
jgi:hypothetical protein